MIIVGITTNDTQPHMNHESCRLPRLEAATILCPSHLPRGLFYELVGCMCSSGQVRTTCSAHLHLRNKCRHTLSHTHTQMLLHAAQVLWSSVNNVLYLSLQALRRLCINRLVWQVCLWCLSLSWPDMTWIHYHPSNVCKTPECRCFWSGREWSLNSLMRKKMMWIKRCAVGFTLTRVAPVICKLIQYKVGVRSLP